ncbi:mitotic interactor and substrate of PLK1 isoform X2 [Bufo gargarizans]|uniref:mitotic interactor and substrate of PLK1 isoform X2 n=1 Tax=Bufo gargarizans TaxID=30331 RepID=UPI001CF26243|nr:mitotic interactor and substrate of PLK1 isoform X2 [Bufo gargarizans]
MEYCRRNILQKDRKTVPENTENGSPKVFILEKENIIEQYVTDSKPFDIEISTEYEIVSSSETLALRSDVTKRSNILECEPEITAKNYPTLQVTSIYTDSDKIYVAKEQEENITDSQTNTDASVSTMDRITRRMFSSFSSNQRINGSQQDLTNSSEETQATHEIDAKKEIWYSSPSPDRRLKVLRGGERFEIRSHLPETSPTKLFVDSDEDADEEEFKPRSRDLIPEKVLALEKDRRDIIKKQGQRKSLDTEEVINISNKNMLNSDVDFTGREGEENKPNIHIEQINFESARQQFIKLEKQRNSLPIMPRPQPRQSWVNTRSLRENYEVTKVKEDQEGKTQKEEYIVNPEITGKDVSSSILHEQFLKTLSLDSVDNGEQEIHEEKESIPNPSDETPIEREIRLALEREESLRKERGILSFGETNEIIEISKNPVLADLSDIPLSKKSKNRAHTSLFIQREIEKEVQREADLKSEGRVAGLYDKGNSQELDERRRLFEQPDEIPVQPQHGISNKITKVTEADLETDNDSKNWSSLDSPQPYSVRMKWKPSPFNAYRNRRLSADNILDVKTPLERSSEQESSGETFVLRKENFQVQPLKFTLPLQDNDVEIDRDHKVGHGERYNKMLRPSLSNIIEQEIQQALERDRELQEEREKSGLLPLKIETDNELNTPHNGYDTHDGTSSLTSNVSNTSSSAPWKGTLGNKTPSYDSSIVPIFRTHRNPNFEASESSGDRLKRQENRYAGIDQSDAVNTEIVESTRVVRHKNTMALRWEAGLYVNEQGD